MTLYMLSDILTYVKKQTRPRGQNKENDLELIKQNLDISPYKVNQLVLNN